MTRPLRVVLSGYWFMGAIHARGRAAAPHFFKLGQTPEITVVCGRKIEEAEANLYAEKRTAKHVVRSMVGFSYRRTPPLAYAPQLAKDGRIGTIRHIRAAYLQDCITDEDFPLVCRPGLDEAGSGALGVSALTETLILGRPLPSSPSGPQASSDDGSAAARGPVGPDDAAVITARTDGVPPEPSFRDGLQMQKCCRRRGRRFSERHLA